MLKEYTQLRKWLVGVVSAISVVALAALALVANPVPAAADTSGYRLGSGDKIRVQVFGHEDLGGEFAVDGSGNISLPMIRSVKAEGLTVSELEDEIENKLKPEYLLNPRVSVEVLNYRPFYIHGEVNQPGEYPYADGMTVIKAVALAGGYTYRARQSKVRITSVGSKGGARDAEPTAPVLPGDVIEVPERYF